MKKQIKTITKTAQEYHPAVGFHYIVEFEDGDKFTMTDDMFMRYFKSYRDNPIDVQALIGRVIHTTEYFRQVNYKTAMDQIKQQQKKKKK